MCFIFKLHREKSLGLYRRNILQDPKWREPLQRPRSHSELDQEIQHVLNLSKSSFSIRYKIHGLHDIQERDRRETRQVPSHHQYKEPNLDQIILVIDKASNHFLFCFLSCSGDKTLHFFANLKKKENFDWTEECEEVFFACYPLFGRFSLSTLGKVSFWLVKTPPKFFL